MRNLLYTLNPSYEVITKKNNPDNYAFTTFYLLLPFCDNSCGELPHNHFVLYKFIMMLDTKKQIYILSEDEYIENKRELFFYGVLSAVAFLLLRHESGCRAVPVSI